MKNQSFLLLIIFSWLFLSACKDTPAPVPIAKNLNPCHPYTLTMTRGHQGYPFSTILFFDAKGRDTIQIEKVSPASRSFEYQIIEYDTAGLPSSLSRHHTQNFNLIGSYQIEWWEKGIKKEVTEYDELGVLKKIEQFNRQQHWDRTQTFRNGNLYGDFTYLNTYTPEDLPLTTIKYNTLTNDTVYMYTATYDSEAKRTSLRYVRNQSPEYNYTITYDYDASDRLILETYKYDNQNLPSRVEIEYLNGELELKRNHYDGNNEYTQYEFYIYDEYKNLLSRSNFNAKTDELIMKFEYGYVCSN